MTGNKNSRNETHCVLRNDPNIFSSSLQLTTFFSIASYKTNEANVNIKFHPRVALW